MQILLNHRCLLFGAGYKLRQKISQALTFANPAYIEARKRGRFTGKMDKDIKGHKILGDEILGDEVLAFPRGFLGQAIKIIGHLPDIQDCRRTCPAVNFIFTGELRPYQSKAVADLLKKDFGSLVASTGAGKTVILLKVIAERRQPTLILVHNKLLLYQWEAMIAKYLGVKAGLVGDGKYSIKPVTVAIINTAVKHLDDLPQHFGQIAQDEGHKIPAVMSSKVIKAFDCRYMVACSATLYRRDGLTRLIHWCIGPVVHKVDPAELIATGAVMAPEIVQCKTAFTYNYNDDYAKMLSVLTKDANRNCLIVKEIHQAVESRPGVVLVVSDRVEHCQRLAEMLSDGYGLKVKVLTGKISTKDRSCIVEAARDGGIDVLVATVSLLGEGFDCPGLTSLFLTTPFKFKGRVIQTIGRVLRPGDGTTPRVFDFQDPVGVLIASAKARAKTYQSQDFKITSRRPSCN